MAKDDYSVIVLKILGYLYGCLKEAIKPNNETLSPYCVLFRVKGKAINEPYWNEVLYMMTQEGLIEGLGFQGAWGPGRICFSDMEDCRITPKGIQHLEENSSMRKAWQVLLDTKDIMVSMLTEILPF